MDTYTQQALFDGETGGAGALRCHRAPRANDSRPRRWVLAGILILAWTGTPQIQAEEPSEPQVGNADRQAAVLAIFRDKCVSCHGPSGAKAGLDLSTRDALVRGGESGPVIALGKPDKSLLYEKVSDGQMPPDDKDPLTASELATLRQWIEQDAQALAPSLTASTALTQHDVLPIMLSPLHRLSSRAAAGGGPGLAYEGRHAARRKIGSGAGARSPRRQHVG